MELYDSNYVYFDWDDELEGKECFLSDSINYLKDDVKDNRQRRFSKVHKHDGNYPFLSEDGICYTFCYYDPYYEFRKAYFEGKQLQFKDSAGNWRDVEGEPIFTRDEYRIKPDECKGCMKYDYCTNKNGIRCRNYCVKVEYVPFDTLDGFITKWEEMNPGCTNRPECTMPMIWVKDKIGGCIYLINGYEPDDSRPVMIDTAWYSLEGLFRNYTFIDGSIIGKVKEE